MILQISSTRALRKIAALKILVKLQLNENPWHPLRGGRWDSEILGGFVDGCGWVGGKGVFSWPCSRPHIQNINVFFPSDVTFSNNFWLLTDLEFYDEDTEDTIVFHVIWLWKRLFPIVFLIYGDCKYCQVN